MKQVFYNVPIILKYETEFLGKKVIMIHGDEFDSDLGWMTKLFFIHFILQRIGINIKAWFLSIAHKVIRFIKGLKKNDLVFDAEKRIFNGYKKDYDVIIAGHTHVAKLYKDAQCVYMNCGCIISKPGYIEIDGGVAKIKRLK
jgi:predicted phosphodiesterase